MYEESTIDPPAEYDPDWPIRQSTIRFCTSRGGEFKDAESVVTVRQNGGNRYPRRFRIKGGWRMTCPLDENAINQWNKYGPDYQPNVTEATPYEEIDFPIESLPEPEYDLLPAPSGEPGAAPPGPISTYGGAHGSSTARAADHVIPDYCTPWSWVRYSTGTFAVFGCFWQAAALPGAHLGIFNTVAYYHAYYWAGTDYWGKDIWRMFQTGTAGNPAGTAWPWTVT